MNITRHISVGPENWRPAPHLLVNTGVYRIPIDMDDDTADAAIAAGAAVEVKLETGARLERKNVVVKRKA